MIAGYHQLSYENKKQAAYLYKVYCEFTRHAILETYKQLIYIEIDRLASALEEGNEELANKYGYNDWFDYIEDDAMSKPFPIAL
jgi:hypothetical protein